ncbi:hypothetical protein [Streptomyces sp. NPDC091217]|uniref:hypothetical protein n=1 Tax=Streptomyces sp. NPDC091217 TaxID=3365975 RepID=UPI003817E129
MRVIDGMHRVNAAISKGRESIEARLFDGNLDESFVLSVKLNVEHGLPLSLAERKSAALHIVSIYPEWSDGTIARVTGLSAKTVAKVRRNDSVSVAQHNKRVGRDGRTRPLNIDQGRLLASQVIEARPDASLREIAREAGISPNTARDVRNRLRRGEEPNSARHYTEGRATTQEQGKKVTDGSFETGTSKGVSARVPAINAQISWESLKRDPSLRSTEAGRFLLRSLSLQALDSETWRRVAEMIPRHRAEGVADLARQCAAAWEDFARYLETLQG